MRTTTKKMPTPPADVGTGQWLTTRETAAMIGVSYRCLANWKQRDIGPVAYRFGNKIVAYKVVDVQAWIESHREKEKSNGQ